MHFDLFFGILIFVQSEDFPLQDGRFSKLSHFSKICGFLSGFFLRTALNAS